MASFVRESGKKDHSSFGFQLSQIKSNMPCEDRYCVKSLVVNECLVQGFSVIDGHGGTYAAESVCAKLLEYIFESISLTLRSSSDLCEADVIAMVTTAIESKILVIDEIIREYIFEKKEELDVSTFFSDLIYPGRPGCCLVVLIIIQDFLFVANVGDCRAVLFSSAKSPLFERQDSWVQSAPSDTLRDLEILTVVRPTDHSGYSKNHGSYYSENITSDHTSYSPTERFLVAMLTNDPQPFRPSQKAFRRYGDKAPERVAGSLSVTRAVGDGYLKWKEISPPEYSQYVPYIKCTPSIYFRRIDDSDLQVVLSSDGLWNFLSCEESLDVYQQFENLAKSRLDRGLVSNEEDIYEELLDNTLMGETNLEFEETIDYLIASQGLQSPFLSPDKSKKRKRGESESDEIAVPEESDFSLPNLSDMLLYRCLNNACKTGNMRMSKLRALSSVTRRRIVDDVTVIAVDIQNCRRLANDVFSVHKRNPICNPESELE